eukprot:9478014-Pyramimonas_sp.AAC.1
MKWPKGCVLHCSRRTLQKAQFRLIRAVSLAADIIRRCRAGRTHLPRRGGHQDQRSWSCTYPSQSARASCRSEGCAGCHEVHELVVVLRDVDPEVVVVAP